jgi:uncharacterized protein YggL (DUF469 family)
MKIEGIIELRDDEEIDRVADKFIDFIEENGWFFGGGYKEVDEEGNAISK